MKHEINTVFDLDINIKISDVIRCHTYYTPLYIRLLNQLTIRFMNQGFCNYSFTVTRYNSLMQNNNSPLINK